MLEGKDTIEYLESIVGKNIYDNCMQQVQLFITISNRKYNNLVTTVRIEKNVDGSFSIYEKEFGDLAVIIKKNKDNEFYSVPFGLCKVIAEKIMSEFNLIDKHEEFTNSIYQKLFYAHELPDNEKMNTFLYYFGIVLIDTINLDIYDSFIDLSNNENFYIDGIKKEFVNIHDNEHEYEDVMYSIAVEDNSNVINIFKMFSSDINDVYYKLTIDELINKAYDDYKQYLFSI